ncbi:hypothetical protein QJN88_22880 [Escherichia coli]|nr:hypothetical protein [Escherichia coli]
MKISAIDYSQNINGDYKATITGGGEGIATLIPVLNDVHQAGLSTTIQFTRAEDKIMSGTVSVNGTDLPTTTFPSQGFTGAYYQLNNDMKLVFNQICIGHLVPQTQANNT